jgi:NAD(P)-dependent dehydrogenase (short-subunit alcohol dehydrogenase family)
MSRELAGKVAIVTGSTQGLGAAVARRFVGEGASVVLSGRNADKGQAIQAELGEAAVFQPADLSRVDDCKTLVERALASFGGVDIVINSAGLSSRDDIDRFDPELFDELMRLNVRAPLLITQAALASLRERQGVVVNIGSVNAYVGQPNLLTYSASKGALMTASRNLANDLQTARVRVFCLNVGWTETEGERDVLAREGKPAEFIADEGQSLPMKRLLQPSEIAEWCLFLASPRTQAFSGAVIDLEQFPLGAPSYPTAQ